jgi:DNA-binding response OmpR family regulator
MRVFKAEDAGEALRLIDVETIDTVLADYHLGDGPDGLELIRRISAALGNACAAALITADHGAEVARTARGSGIALLHKPLRPAALRALLAAFSLRSARGSAA